MMADSSSINDKISSESSSSSNTGNKNPNELIPIQNQKNEKWKSTDNLCVLSSETSKRSKIAGGIEGTDGEKTRKGRKNKMSTSHSTSVISSPSLNSFVSQSGRISPAGAEKYSTLLEISPHQPGSNLDQRSNSGLEANHERVGLSPTQGSASSPKINGSYLTCYSSSPKNLTLAANASGESSDERGAKYESIKPQVPRESSFERSVSFQETILDLEKSNEFARSSDNRSLDSYQQVIECPSSSVLSQSWSSKDKERERKESKENKTSDKEKEKKKKSWYNVLSRTYKSRSEELKRLFKGMPSDERLIVDYSCALQKEILVHGRLYVTPNYFCFYSKIFGWETCLLIKCKDIIAMTKEKTARVIPNAIQVSSDTEKHFFTSFAARDKTFLMLFRIWQNALMDQQMSTAELWHWVHSSYGEELGLTSDDDDYVAPSTEDDLRSSSYNSAMALDLQSEVSSTALLKAAKGSSLDSMEDGSQGESNLEECPGICPKIPSNRDVLFEPSENSGAESPAVPSLDDPPTYVPRSYSPQADDDELPTDLSDAVGSDMDNEKLTGTGNETVNCPNIQTHHVGREVMNTVYGLPIDTVFELLFTDSKFILDLHTARKTYDIVASPWQSNPETNQKIRQVTYTLTLPTNSFGPKVSHVTETQVISAFSNASEIYTVDAEASNSGIPYADSFCVSNHWCLTKESKNETRLCLWSQVKYKKNVWGFMKSVIDKNACSGMDSFMNDVNDSLLQEVDKSNVKKTKRRRRRAGSKNSELSDTLNHIPSALGINTDTHKSTQFPLRKMTLPSISNEVDSSSVISSMKSAAFLLLCFLLIINAVLYYRLYDLEERVVGTVSYRNLELEASILQFASATGDSEGLAEEWLKILHQQESLHAEEVERWRASVAEAANHLKKAEESLRNLHSSIPSTQDSKLQALLQQLQSLRKTRQQHSSKAAQAVKDKGGTDNMDEL